MPEGSPLRRTIGPLGRVLDFSGRTRRADYWPYILLLFGIYLVGIVLVATAISRGMGPPVTQMFLLVAILALLAFAATVRRLHDVGWSGRWMAAYLVMMLAFIAFFLHWRYGLQHDPYGGQPGLLFRIMPLLMAFNIVMNCIGLLVFVICLLDGNAGPNRFGADPKGRSAP